MALSASNIFNIRSTATASNVNGGFFNPANANFLTDATATSATGNAPVISSASYNFAAGDVGAYIYVKSGTNWTPGWYPITSVASNQATVNAAIGASFNLVNGQYVYNTVAGVATTASPTGGTFGVDYSYLNTALGAVSDYASAISSTTMTSVTAAFTPVMVGNGFHLNNAGTGAFGIVGWYEIVSYNSATSVVTDRTTNSGTAMVAGQGKIGAALSLGSADDAVFELAVSSSTAAATYNIKGGSTYTIGGAVSIAAAGNASWPIRLLGYTTTPGDAITGSNRPIMACGASTFTFGANWNYYNLQFTGTAGPVVQGGAANVSRNCKITNSSTTSGRSAITPSTDGCVLECELISYRGNGINHANISGVTILNCYIHDCDVGFLNSATSANNNGLIGNIIESCVTASVKLSAAQVSGFIAVNNTLFGSTNKTGIGFSFASGCTDIRLINNIITGFSTGVSHADNQTVGFDNFNNYQNNTNDVSSAAQWQKGPNDTAIAPAFTSVGQVTGATATTTAGNHIVQSGATFQSGAIPVVAGRDYVYVVSGTGVTAGIYGIASVDSDTQITTDIAITANATADKVFQITVGHNFAVGTAMKGLGAPGVFPGGLTTGYGEQGAVQRQEAGGSGAIIFTEQY